MDEKEIRIGNLTIFQTHLLDQLWACNTCEQLSAYLNTLPSNVRLEAISLVKLIEVEVLDQALEETEDYSEANQLLIQFML